MIVCLIVSVTVKEKNEPFIKLQTENLIAFVRVMT